VIVAEEVPILIEMGGWTDEIVEIEVPERGFEKIVADERLPNVLPSDVLMIK
jgi:hypothetical protein